SERLASGENCSPIEGKDFGNKPSEYSNSRTKEKLAAVSSTSPPEIVDDEQENPRYDSNFDPTGRWFHCGGNGGFVFPPG
ncbi:MAG: hypothetical protein ACE5JX_18400, partial [Acidobacteriota bacterium]